MHFSGDQVMKRQSLLTQTQRTLSISYSFINVGNQDLLHALPLNIRQHDKQIQTELVKVKY